MSKILIVDDEPQIRRILSVLLAEQGFQVAEAVSGEKAIEVASRLRPDVILLDLNMPGMDGLAALRRLLDQQPKVDCIIMTAHGTIRSAVTAMMMGAYHYLTKPFDNSELIMVIERALERRRLSTEVEELRSELSTRYGFNEIVGISPKLQAVFRTIAKVAQVEATVLIEGESGTGKELAARAVHRRSNRAQGPFVTVNCGAVPHSLFEAEFFGYERGAFTDAREARGGLFERSQGGTLFLDEVGELPLDTQVKLLRVLQDHEVTRLGGQQPIKVDVRIIAASNVDLRAAVERSQFREDLYWRLNVVRIVLPALRDRRQDIPLLIDHLIERFNGQLGLSIDSISADARCLLEAYDWPGNVRELENALCSAVIMCDENNVTVDDLPPRIRGEVDNRAGDELGSKSAGRQHNLANITLAEAVSEAVEKIERTLIAARLAQMGGNRTATAESLRISRKSLFNKMRQYRLGAEETDAGANSSGPFGDRDE